MVGQGTLGGNNVGERCHEGGYGRGACNVHADVGTQKLYCT